MRFGSIFVATPINTGCYCGKSRLTTPITIKFCFFDPESQGTQKPQTVGIAGRSEGVGEGLRPRHLFLQVKSDGIGRRFSPIFSPRTRGAFVPFSSPGVSFLGIWLLRATQGETGLQTAPFFQPNHKVSQRQRGLPLPLGY